MSEREFFFILIGINIGIIIGWFSCKKFKGNLESLIKWLNGKKEVIEHQSKKEIVEAEDIIGISI